MATGDVIVKDAFEHLKAILDTPEKIEARKKAHPYCQECLTGCNKKFYVGSQPERRAREYCLERGDPECVGIYTQEDYEFGYQQLKKDGYNLTLEEIKGFLNPSFWLSTNVTLKGKEFSPFWYQDRALRCTSKKMVLRMSRRAGKSELLAGRCVHRLFNSKHTYYRMLVICPAKAQAKELWDKITDYLSSNPDLNNSVVLKRTPYYEVLIPANGNYVRIFTAGSKSGNQAMSVRGQSGNEVILDEMDYLEADDISTITPIMTDVGGGNFMGASTLKGSETMFYHYCHNTSVKEFYIPFKFRPDWSPLKEQEARDADRNMNELKWDLEYEVKWTARLDGVFQRSFVLAAFNQKKYGYNTYTYNPGWKYLMGVDWNGDNNGTRIMVIGYSPDENKIYTVRKSVVAYKNWTQTKALELIFEMNRTWKPEMIVIDKGFGQFQDEVIRSVGQQAEQVLWSNEDASDDIRTDARLKDILHVVDFGGTIEIPNLYTKRDEKVQAKQFLIENLQRMFEQGSICLAQDEELRSQLLDYVVDKFSIKGYPVYKAGLSGDHDLDALALACFGFSKKYHHEFQQSKPVIAVAMATKPMEYMSQGNGELTNPALREEKEEEKQIVMPIVQRDFFKDRATRAFGDVPKRSISRGARIKLPRA